MKKYLVTIYTRSNACLNPNKELFQHILKAKTAKHAKLDTWYYFDAWFNYCKYFGLQTECAPCEDSGEACGVCNKNGACVPSDGFCYYGRKNEKVFDKG